MAPDQPSVYLTWPNAFHPLPDNIPPVLPPPLDERTLRAPFGIDNDLYNFALRPEIPLTFAAAYVVTVFALNAYNRKRDHQPWSISKTAPFGYFVVVHNVVLALYSFATFAAMTRAIGETWPGFNNENGAAGVADALCKLHGPRGLGDAATFNTTINIWEIKNTAMHLLPAGNPDPTDVGRLWNEGLAFWGWIFYVSKFYEVIDTLIILAKGKRSATLQTYHHAGAMLCMWAGIRYMSPPIWMFVFINSAIHAMMYTYFTASALGIKVPRGLKRTLTSLQIAQFVFGASYAAAHLFVAYDIPVQTPYQVVSAVERVVSTASSAASKASSTVSEFYETPTVTATAAIGSLVKKLLLRAAGEEGVAERVAMSRPDASAFISSAPEIVEKMEKIWERRFETHYRQEWTRVNCIDTTGQAFAIYLNLLYLTPLTWLFGRFFLRAYSSRRRNSTNPRSASEVARMAADISRDAKKDTEQSFEEGGIKAEDELARSSSQGKEKGEELYEQLRKDVKSMKDGTFRDRRVSERVQSYEGKVKTAAEKATEKAREVAQKATESVREGVKSMTNGGDSDAKDGSAVEDAPTEETKEESASSQPESATESKDDSKDTAPTTGKGEGTSEPAGKDDDKSESTSKPEESAQSSDKPAESASKPDQSSQTSGNQQKASASPSKKGKKSKAANKQQRASSESGNKDEGKSESANKQDESPKSSDKQEEDTAESADKQEDHLAASEPLRPAPESAQSTGEEDSSSQQPSSDDNDKGKTYKEVVEGEGEEAQPDAGSSKPEDDGPSTPQQEDTDAMGRSGVGIDAEDTTSPSSSSDKQAEI